MKWLELFFGKRVEVQAFGAFHRGEAQPTHHSLLINGVKTDVVAGVKIRGVMIGLHAIRSIREIDPER